MYVNFETKKIKYKNVKIIEENKKKSKNILTPEVKIKTDQLKKLREFVLYLAVLIVVRQYLK